MRTADDRKKLRELAEAHPLLEAWADRIAAAINPPDSGHRQT